MLQSNFGKSRGLRKKQLFYIFLYIIEELLLSYLQKYHVNVYLTCWGWKIGHQDVVKKKIWPKFWSKQKLIKVPIKKKNLIKLFIKKKNFIKLLINKKMLIKFLAKKKKLIKILAKFFFHNVLAPNFFPPTCQIHIHMIFLQVWKE